MMILQPQHRVVIHREDCVLERRDINFLDAPVFTEDLMNQNYTLLHGANLSLTCKANGIPTPSIEWYFDELRIVDNQHWTIEENNEVLVLNDVVAEISGVYRCVANNRVANISSIATVKVFGKRCSSFISCKKRK